MIFSLLRQSLIKASASKLKIIDDLFVCSQGPAIKINSNQRYATTAVSSSIIRLIAEQNNLPIQVDFSHYFVIYNFNDKDDDDIDDCENIYYCDDDKTMALVINSQILFISP